jgi:hypothetical protein
MISPSNQSKQNHSKKMFKHYHTLVFHVC